MLHHKKRTLPILGLIIVAAAFLRLYHIDYQSLSFDELRSAESTIPSNKLITINEVSENFGSQAFYILLFFIFKFLGYEAVVGRLTFAIIGILAVPIFYFLGKEFGRPEIGLFSAFLVAFNYFHIDYSQELNFYSMIFLFSALSYLFFIRSYKYSRDLDFIIYSLLTICLLRTHNYGFIIFLSQIATVLVLCKFYNTEWKFVNGFAFSVVIILLFAPWNQAVINDLVIGYEWMPRPKFYFMLGYAYNYFGKDIVVTLICFVLIALFAKPFIRREDSEKNLIPLHVILILWLSLTHLFTFVKSFFGNSIMDIRLTISFLPVWFVIIAIGWSKITSTKLKLGVAACIVLSVLVNLFFIRKYYTTVQKEQVREIAQIVKSKNTAGDSIYSESPSVLNFYFQNHPNQVIHLDSLQHDSLTLHSVNTFWLINIGSLKGDEFPQLTDRFEIAQKYSLYQVDALLMVKKR